jgi:molybdate transport system ATP-binding protein
MLKIENFSINAQESNVFTIDKFLAENAKKVNIVGSNRTGKTIFFKAVHGEYFDFSGDIYIKEKPPVFYKKRKKTMLIENIPHLLPEDSVWKNITLPIIKVTSGQKEKIPELCQMAELGEIYGRRVKHLSHSSQKFVELIRAVIQLPYIILIDDADSFFDEINLLKMHRICNYAIDNGTTLLVSSKRKLENFDLYFRVQNKELAQI